MKLLANFNTISASKQFLFIEIMVSAAKISEMKRLFLYFEVGPLL